MLAAIGLTTVAAAETAGGSAADPVAAVDAQLATRPNDPQLLFRRGVALSSSGRSAEAAAVFRRLIDAHPEWAAAYNNLAVIDAAQGDYGSALHLLEKAVTLKIGYATALHNLGDVHLQLAAAAYGQAVHADGSDATASRRLATLQPLVSSDMPTAVATTPDTAGRLADVGTVSRATVVGASAPVAAASSASAVGDASTADVTAVVRSWADDWSRRDVDAYIGYYAPDFKGHAASVDAWRAERRARLTKPTTIKVAVSDLVVSVVGKRATVRFRQDYSSDSLHTVDRKELTLHRNPTGRWLIAEETVVH